MLDDLLIKMKMIDDSVEKGKMMSADGLTYKGKVFCFDYNNKMVFKLGKGYDIQSHGITEYEFLNPFKKKGPMLAWFEIEYKYKECFELLASKALEVMKND